MSPPERSGDLGGSPQRKQGAHPVIELVRSALEDALAQYFATPCHITSLVGRPSPYRSSHALEELEVHLDHDTRLAIMFKDLSRAALLEDALQAQPSFLYHPLREIETYRVILAPRALGTANCYGAVLDPPGRYWLFLEKVGGRELYQVGEISVWQEAARWLAQLHSRFAGTENLQQLSRTAHLLTYDKDYYGLWITRAREFAGRPGPASPERRRREPAGDARSIAWLARRYEPVARRLATLPVTFIHGEFYASNIVVQEAPAGLRVCPVDWEMAALGPGLVDLAALTAGAWNEKERTAIVQAYYQALPATGNRLGEDEFLIAFDFCRLHLAVQWLGWSAAWKPPVEHTQDWLGEALRLAKKLGL